MKKSIGVLAVIIIAIGCFVLAGIIIFSSKLFKNFSFNFGDFDFSWIEDSNNLVEQQEFEINNLYIEGDVVNVFVDRNEDSNNIEVEFYSDDEEDEYKFVEEENKISLKIKNDDRFRVRNNSKLVVRIPDAFENVLNIDISVGDIKINNFTYLNADVDVNTGNVEVGVMNELNANVDVGNVEVEAINRIKAKCNTGNVEVDRINNKADIEVAIGDVKLDEVTLTDESNIKVNMGNIKIRELTGVYADASAGVGEVKVDDNDRTSEVTLKVRTEVGDIKINY